MKKDGKNICRQLKAIRRRVADENNIPLKQHDCTYEGDCNGTCPRCEAEMRYLEQELHRRMTLGKAAAVAGVAMTMALASCTEGKIEGDVEPDPTPGIVIPEDTAPDTTSGATHNDKQPTIEYQP